VDIRKHVYLDYAATTPVDERVVEVMLPYFRQVYGNPSSVHQWGQAGEAAVEDARQKTAEAFGARSNEIVFTSCGSESDNLALRGVAHAMRKQRGANHILTTPVEHHAVLHTVQQLAALDGFNVEYLPVDEFGMVDPEDVRSSIRHDTAIVSVIYANNEIGTINPISQIGSVCRAVGVPFHTDAVQAAAHLKIDVCKDSIDLMSIGAHKFYGPKGVGALYVRQGTPILPIQTGGGQEHGLRAGTQNVPLIVGLAESLVLNQRDLDERWSRYSVIRDHLIGAVLETIPDVRLTGHPSQRLPNHTSFVFEGVDGNRLLMMLDVAGYACSSGSACKTGNPKPSEVLTAIGVAKTWALGSLRITLGIDSTPETIHEFPIVLAEMILKQRGIRGV
jgi:cysteine desulfurase